MMPSKLVKDGKVQALRAKSFKNGQWEKAASPPSPRSLSMHSTLTVLSCRTPSGLSEWMTQTCR